MSKDLLGYLDSIIHPQDRFYGQEEEEEEAGADGAGDDDAGGEGDDAGSDDEGKDGEGKDDEKGDSEEIDETALEPESRTKEEKKADEDAGKDDDDDADPDDLKAIDKRIDKRLSPLEAKIQAQNDEIEVNAYLQLNPEMSKYKGVMLKYVSHPAYKNVPIAGIGAIVSAKDQQRLGAAKERAAQKKAKESKGGGSAERGGGDGGGAKKDWSTMPKAEFEAELLRFKSGAGVKK